MAIVGITSACIHLVVIALVFQYSLYVSISIFCTTLFFAYSFGVVNAIIKKEEEYVLYQYKTLILIVTVGLLYLLQQPILQYLDITSIALSSILFFGRIGCFLSGCCHGIPSKKGVTYHTHKETKNCLEEVSFIPIQLIEAGVHLVNLIIGYILLVNNTNPGIILITNISLYSLARFVLEFYRGDTTRHFYYNISEAQWFAYVYLIVGLFLSSSYFKKITVPLLIICIIFSAIICIKLMQKTSLQLITSKLFEEIKSLSLKGDVTPNFIFKSQVEKGIEIAFSKIYNPQKDHLHVSLYIEKQHQVEKILKKIQKKLSYSNCPMICIRSQNIEGVYHFILKT